MRHNSDGNEIDFGRILRSLRRSKKYSQEQVAKMLFLTRPAYTYYETGRTVPDPETIRRISIIYGMAPDELIRYPNPPEKKRAEDTPREPGALTESERKLIEFIRANRSDDENKDMLSLAVKMAFDQRDSRKKADK